MDLCCFFLVKVIKSQRAARSLPAGSAGWRWSPGMTPKKYGGAQEAGCRVRRNRARSDRMRQPLPEGLTDGDSTAMDVRSVGIEGSGGW